MDALKVSAHRAVKASAILSLGAAGKACLGSREADNRIWPCDKIEKTGAGEATRRVGTLWNEGPGTNNIKLERSVHHGKTSVRATILSGAIDHLAETFR
jgi:hypothetical protein